MSESGSFNSGGYQGRYLEFNWWIEEKNSSGNWIRIGWNLIPRGGSATWYNTRSITVNIDGEQVFYAGSGTTRSYKNTIFASGSKTLYNAGGRVFSASTSGDIYVWGRNNAVGSGSWTLPTLAISPTLPNYISVTGGAGGSWVNKNDPKFSVSWSGATSGTYTIAEYSIDVAKYGTNNWGNTGSVYTSSTSGSATRTISGASGGEKYQVRVGMKTSDGTWWNHTYWGGVLIVYSSPTAPTTLSVPSSVEIDSGFNITWSGAKAGSNGIAGYDLEARAYNGSSWTDWVRILNCKNQSSYSVSKIKDLSINGVSYSKNGASIKFQYRVRTSDGLIATSSWKDSGQIGITINSPTVPRKFINQWYYK